MFLMVPPKDGFAHILLQLKLCCNSIKIWCSIGNYYLHYVVCTMDIEEEIVVVESVGGVDGPLACEDVGTNSLNMESV